jgi:hypothetical protein
MKAQLKPVSFASKLAQLVSRALPCTPVSDASDGSHVALCDLSGRAGEIHLGPAIRTV